MRTGVSLCFLGFLIRCRSMVTIGQTIGDGIGPAFRISCRTQARYFCITLQSRTVKANGFLNFWSVNFEYIKKCQKGWTPKSSKKLSTCSYHEVSQDIIQYYQRKSLHLQSSLKADDALELNQIWSDFCWSVNINPPTGSFTLGIIVNHGSPWGFRSFRIRSVAGNDISMGYSR